MMPQLTAPIRFAHPAAFFLLLLIPAYYITRASFHGAAPAIPLTLVNGSGERFKWRSRLVTALRALAAIFELCCYIAGCVALADPCATESRKVYLSEGDAIMFVLDVSPSMAAADMNGTRLAAAKSAIETISRAADNASLGLVEMADTAVCLVPPTTDREAFFTRLSSVTVGDLGDGTAIGNGLSCAAFHLERPLSTPGATLLEASGESAEEVSSLLDERSQFIILITDGENNSGTIHPHTAASLIFRKNISLYVLGVGTSGLVPIDYTDPLTGKTYSGYLDSDPDKKALARLAEEGGGEFFETPDTTALLDAVSQIRAVSRTTQPYRIDTREQSLYRLPLIAALISAALAWIIRRLILIERI